MLRKLFVLMVAVLPLVSYGQWKSTVARYQVSDSTTKDVMSEEWTYVKLAPSEDEALKYEISRVRIRDGKRVSFTKETSSDWEKKIEDTPKTFTTRHVFNKHPGLLEVGQKGMGHVEVRRLLESEPAKWPMFFEVDLDPPFLKATFTITVLGRNEIARMVIVEWYAPGEYQFPVKKLIEAYGREDNLISKTEYVRTH